MVDRYAYSGVAFTAAKVGTPPQGGAPVCGWTRGPLWSRGPGEEGPQNGRLERDA